MSKITPQPVIDRLNEGIDSALKQIRQYKAPKNVEDQPVISKLRSKPSLAEVEKFTKELVSDLKSNPSPLLAQGLSEDRVKALLNDD